METRDRTGSDASEQPILVSTVTPVYGGEKTLAELVRELARVREEWEQRGLPLRLCEAIFVDDDAVDDSSDVLASLQQEAPWIRTITLSTNFGQHPATVAGILHTCGDWVVTLDEDLQHHPSRILPLIELAVEESKDLVYATSRAVHGAVHRDLGSRGLKFFLALVTGRPQLGTFSSFRLARGSIARAAAAVSAHDSYLDIVLGWFTHRAGALPMSFRDHRYAETGRSGYGLRRLLSHARRALVSSQVHWLRFAAALGVVAMLFSASLGAGILLQYLWAPGTIEVRGWTSLFLSIVFFGGLTSFLTGVVLEYLSTVVLKAQGKPTFFVVDRSSDQRLRRALAATRAHAPPAA